MTDYPPAPPPPPDNPYGPGPGQPVPPPPGQAYGPPPGQAYGPPPGQPYPAAPGQAYGLPPGQAYPAIPGQPYGPPVPPGMYFDPASSLVLPNGVVLASNGRRVGAYFLSILLAIVTLVIGYVIWGLIAWSKGTSPAFQVLGMKVWRPAENRVAGWGIMALRDIVGTIAQGILSIITLLISFILFLTGNQRKTIPDHIAGTVVLHDPTKVLG